MGHNICFYAELTKIITITKYSLLSTALKIVSYLAPICNGYTPVCPPVQGDHPLASKQIISHTGITVLYDPHQYRPCSVSNISC